MITSKTEKPISNEVGFSKNNSSFISASFSTFAVSPGVLRGGRSLSEERAEMM